MPSSDMKLRISKASKQYYLSAQNTLINYSLIFYNLESALSTNIDYQHFTCQIWEYTSPSLE